MERFKVTAESADHVESLGVVFFSTREEAERHAKALACDDLVATVWKCTITALGEVSSYLCEYAEVAV